MISFESIREIIRNRLNSFLTKYVIISNSQYGFGANTSTLQIILCQI